MMKTGKFLILLISPSGIPAMQTAEMASRLKEAEPTMVLGPSFSDSNPLPMIPITARRISGADDPGDKVVVDEKSKIFLSLFERAVSKIFIIFILYKGVCWGL